MGATLFFGKNFGSVFCWPRRREGAQERVARTIPLRRSLEHLATNSRNNQCDYYHFAAHVKPTWIEGCEAHVSAHAAVQQDYVGRVRHNQNHILVGLLNLKKRAVPGAWVPRFICGCRWVLYRPTSAMQRETPSLFASE